MKKYVKPELFYERFELSQHIADCAWELTNSTKDTCSATADPVKLPGFANLFAHTTSGCVNIPVEYGGTYEGYCYQPGEDGINVFIS